MSQNTEALHQRIKAIDLNRASAAALLEEKRFDLVMNPEDATLRDQVESLEREIGGYERETARIESAIAELGRRDGVAERRKHLAQLSDHHSDVRTTGKRMTALTEKLIAQIEGVGPILSELATLSDTRRVHASAVLREAPLRSRAANNRHSYVEAASRRNGVVSAVVVAAMWRAGLGRLGLDLEPLVSIVPPRDGTTDRYLKGDLRTLLHECIERSDRLLYQALDDVLQAAKA
jgi:hypothetical protein